MRRQREERDVELEMDDAWTCSFLAWLPENADADEATLRHVVREGVAARSRGRLRERIARVADAGGIEVLPLGPAHDRLEPAWFALARSRDGVLPPGGGLVEVSATSRLDADTVALWASMLGARSLASAFGGRVVDPAWPRVMTSEHDDDVLPESPRVVMGDFMLVLSAADPSGRHGHLITFGLSRFGLPELEVGDVPEAALPALGRAATAIAADMLERAIAAPTDESGVRLLRLPLELEVTRSMVDRAFGAAPQEGLAGARVGLRPLRLPDGSPLLRFGPPSESMMPRVVWARALAHVVGAPWRAPPRDRGH